MDSEANDNPGALIRWTELPEGWRGVSEAGIYRIGSTVDVVRGTTWDAWVNLGAGIVEWFGNCPTRAAVMAVCQQHSDRETYRSTQSRRSAA